LVFGAVDNYLGLSSVEVNTARFKPQSSRRHGDPHHVALSLRPRFRTRTHSKSKPPCAG